MTSRYAHEVSAMRAACDAAARVIEKHRMVGFAHTEKNDRSFVTQADGEAEDAIKAVLKRECPEYGVFGEEKGKDGVQDKRFIIDPIDGTGNYLRDLPNYGPMIGLEVDGEIVAGVISMVRSRETYWAEKGQGAFGLWNGSGGSGRDGGLPKPERVHVSKTSKLSEAFFSFDGFFKYWPKHLQTFDAFNQACFNSRYYSCLSAHAFVATGRVDFAVIPYWQPWDFAAASVIIREAGGRLTNQKGEETIYGDSILGPPHHYGDWIVTSNGKLHGDVLALLEKNTPSV